jgi:hypothetical protein
MCLLVDIVDIVSNKLTRRPIETIPPNLGGTTRALVDDFYYYS